MEIDFTCQLPEFLEYDLWEPFTSAIVDDDDDHHLFYDDAWTPYGLPKTLFELFGIINDDWSISEIPEVVLNPTSDSFRVTIPTIRVSPLPWNSGHYFQPSTTSDNYQIWFTLQLYRNSGGVL